MEEKRFSRFIAFFLFVFFVVPLLVIGGISTTMLTDNEEDFQLVYHVVFLGVLDSMALICLIGTIFRFVELQKFKGKIVIGSLSSKKKKDEVPRFVVNFAVLGIIIFSLFIVLSTAHKLVRSVNELVEAI